MCPHCGAHPTTATRPGEDGKLPTLHGLQRRPKHYPTTIVGERSYWALKLRELLAMMDGPDVGRSNVFITKTCHVGSEDVKRLIRLRGWSAKKAATQWPKYHIEITRHWCRNVIDWLHMFLRLHWLPKRRAIDVYTPISLRILRISKQII